MNNNTATRLLLFWLTLTLILIVFLGGGVLLHFDPQYKDVITHSWSLILGGVMGAFTVYFGSKNGNGNGTYPPKDG